MISFALIPLFIQGNRRNIPIHTIYGASPAYVRSLCGGAIVKACRIIAEIHGFVDFLISLPSGPIVEALFTFSTPILTISLLLIGLTVKTNRNCRILKAIRIPPNYVQYVRIICSQFGQPVYPLLSLDYPTRERPIYNF